MLPRPIRWRIVEALTLPLFIFDRVSEALFQSWFRLTIAVYRVLEKYEERSSPFSAQHACIRQHFRLNCLISRRGIRRYVSELKSKSTKPALLLSTHTNFSLVSALHIASSLPIANIVAFPEQQEGAWKLYDITVGARPEVIKVRPGVLREAANHIFNGTSVTLYPDDGDKIHPSCFRLIEEGIPIGFYYGSVSPNGVPEFVFRYYDGAARAQDCAEAFLAFLRDDCHLSNSFYLSR
jgi:hypothetical protein